MKLPERHLCEVEKRFRSAATETKTSRKDLARQRLSTLRLGQRARVHRTHQVEQSRRWISPRYSRMVDHFEPLSTLDVSLNKNGVGLGLEETFQNLHRRRSARAVRRSTRTVRGRLHSTGYPKKWRTCNQQCRSPRCVSFL